MSPVRAKFRGRVGVGQYKIMLVQYSKTIEVCVCVCVVCVWCKSFHTIEVMKV